MNKLKIDILRRIEKFTEILGGKPIVGKGNENHIDDEWPDNMIYKGELFLNLKDNKLYTSNGTEIIQLNQNYNHILNGLEVIKPPTAGEGIGLDLKISTGNAIINGKHVHHISKYDNSDVSDYQINLTGYPLSVDKIILLYGKQKQILIQTTDSIEMEFVQGVITGTNLISSFNNLILKNLTTDILYRLLYIDPITLGIDHLLNNNHILLGIIFIPANYTISSRNKLEPISLSTETSSFPLQEKSYKDLLKNRINNIETWNTEKVFYKSQIIRDRNNLYIAHKTFGNGYESDIKKFLIPDYLETENPEGDPENSDFENVLSIINVDYRDPNSKTQGKMYWKMANMSLQKSLNPNYSKYIVATVPILDPLNIDDLKTIDLPEVTVNGVRLTVGYDNYNKNEAQIYFAKLGEFQQFDINNYTPQDLEDLVISSREISEGYYIIWNEEKIGYSFTNGNYDIVIHYKL
jgi:hypothetical protein